MRRAWLAVIALAACNVRAVDFTPISGGNQGPDAGSDAGDAGGPRCALRGYPWLPVLPTGRGPAQLAHGDLDGDGIDDLVAAETTEARLRVWLGSADGTYRVVDDIDTGGAALGVALGDLDKDGRLDAVAINGNGTIAVMRGQGDGHFQVSVVTALAQPTALALGDLDGDGALDVVITGNDGEADAVYVLHGDGKAGFGRPLVRLLPQPASALVLADFDGNGKLDVATAGSAAAIVTLYGLDGAELGKTLTTPIEAGANGLAAADLDGDQHPDLVVAHTVNQVSVLIASGLAFQPLGSYDTAGTPLGLALADLDHDGALDAVIPVRSGVSVLPGKKGGGFAPSISYLGVGAPAPPLVTDVNHDGALDLVLADRTASFVSITLGNADGTLRGGPVSPAGGSPQTVALGDLDGDGVLDAVVSSTAGALGTQRGGGDGRFAAPVSVATSGVARFVLADLNKDGLLDVVSSGNGAQVAVRLGDGKGHFTPPIIAPAFGISVIDLAVGDLDGDGTPDVVVVLQQAETTMIGALRGTGGGQLVPFAPPPTLTPDSGPIALADFDGDGHLDVAVGGATLVVLYGRGDGAFDSLASPLPTAGALTLAAVDLDGDHAPDLVLTRLPNVVEVGLNLGHRAFSPAAAIYPTGNFPAGLAVGDLDGDGHPDVATANETDGTISVLAGRGDGTLAPAATYLGDNQSFTVALGDVDHDGLVDLVTASTGHDELTVLRASCLAR